MRPRLFQIADCPTGQLSIMARPRGGEWLVDEIAQLGNAGVNTLVSLLEDGEAAECDLADEALIAVKAGLRFLRFPIADRGVPDSKQRAEQLADELVTDLRAGRHVVIHCRAGIGRSALIAACVLVKSGMTLDGAWGAVSRARGVAVPDTVEQRDWAERLISPRRDKGCRHG